MNKFNVFVLSSIALVLLIPAVALNDAFAEQAIIGTGRGGGNTAEFFVIDKDTGTELKILDQDSEVFISGLAFSPDEFLTSSASDDKSQSDSGMAQISFVLNQGSPSASVFEFSGFNDLICHDISFSSDGTLFCSLQITVDVNGTPKQLLGLYTVDLLLGQYTLVGTSEEDSVGNGLAIDSDGTIYLGTQNGLFTLDSVTGQSTSIGAWNIPGFSSCQPVGMDYDSLEILYGLFECIVVEGVDEPVFLAPIDTQTGEVTSLIPIANNGANSIAFSPFEFDFLIGSDYGSLDDVGSTTIAISGTPLTGVSIFATGNNEISICGNTSLSLISSNDVDFTCNDTDITTISGPIESVFTSNDGSTVSATLNNQDHVSFDSENSVISNLGSNPITVTINDEDVVILPGESISLFTPADHYLGYPAKTENKRHHDDDDDDRNNHDHKHSKYYDLAQKWTLTNSGEIKSDLNDFCLDVEGANPNNGANVIMWPCHDGDNQKWTISNSNQIYSSLNDKCLSIEDADKHKKANVEMLTCNVTSPDNTSKKGISLVDPFEESKYDLKKLKYLYNPVDKNDEGIQDVESHLVAYDIKQSKGESKFKGAKNILVINQFGELTVDIKKAKMLLVPSAKDHESIPEQLSQINIDYLKCYDAKVSKGTPKFEKRTVDLEDQFGMSSMKVVKPKMLCSPVDVNGQGIIIEDNLVMCYDLKKPKDTKFEKISVFTNNEFGSEKLKVKNAKRLCVPTLGAGSDPLPDPEPVIAPILSIIKNTPTDDGFRFTITNNDLNVISLAVINTQGGSGSSSTIELISGNNYSISEDYLPPGFSIMNSDCSINGVSIGNTTFDANENDVIVCTFDNEFTPPVAPTLTITKNTNAAGDFTFDVDSTTDSFSKLISVEETTASVGPFDLVSGNIYTVSEVSLPPNFALTSSDCTINGVSVGTTFTTADDDVIVCTFDNTFTEPEPATLTITKNTNAAGDFTFDVDSTTDSFSVQLSVEESSATSNTYELILGNTYTISEVSLPPNFALTSSDCTINGQSIGDTMFTPIGGETILCTFTNSFSAPSTLTIIKMADSSGDFTFDVDSTTDSFSVQLSVEESSATVGPFDLVSGNIYTVSEIVPPNFALTSSDCTINGQSIGDTMFTPIGGETILCTFTNTLN